MVNYDGLYNKNFFGDKLNQNYFSDKNLYFQIIENGIITPFNYFMINNKKVGFGGIIDGEGNFVQSSFIHGGMGDAHRPEKFTTCSETVIYLGMLIHVWGHCLTDNIKRIWFLKSDFYKEHFHHCKLVYVPMYDGIIPNFAKLLKILGVEVENLTPISTPTKFEKIILPDESFFGGDISVDRFFTREYVETVDIIRNYAKKNYLPISQKKFFYFYGENQIGEGRLAEYFQAKGYEIIQPEKIPLDEQLNILANCNSFASTIGSISHNIIFLRDHSNAVLIPRIASNPNEYQLALNQILDLEIFYIDSALSIFACNYSGPLCYIVSENLRKFFGEEIKEKYTPEDFITFINYAKFAKTQHLKLNPDEEKYFEKILPEFIKSLKMFL